MSVLSPQHRNGRAEYQHIATVTTLIVVCVTLAAAVAVLLPMAVS